MRACRDGDFHRLEDGIWYPTEPVCHRDEEYDEAGFDALLLMQRRHFWYRGRHRFLLAAVKQDVARRHRCLGSAIDLGAGCGGWAEYLLRYGRGLVEEIALGDSSARALKLARSTLGGRLAYYQIDLLRLGWYERWDAAFLLDVLEHIPEDEQVLLQIREALRPGGVLFVTTPAIQAFWTYNDEFAAHQRRYSRRDFRILAERTGFELVQARYFMFFLSPLLLSSRMRKPPSDLSREQRREFLFRTHRVPPSFLNEVLALAFAAETPLGLWLPFPWGTSILGVFRKPLPAGQSAQ